MCVRVFIVGFGPGLDSMSPARSRRSASHAAGTHDWPPPKTGRQGLRRGRWIQFAQCSPRLWHTNHKQAVSVWCPTTSRLYPFGAVGLVYHLLHMIMFNLHFSVQEDE